MECLGERYMCRNCALVSIEMCEKCPSKPVVIWSLVPHHDFAQLELASAYVLHQHLEGREAELGGQRVEGLLLHLLQLYALPQLLHQLHPQPRLQTDSGRGGARHKHNGAVAPPPLKEGGGKHTQSASSRLTQSLCFRASSSDVDLSSGDSSVEIFFSIWP